MHDQSPAHSVMGADEVLTSHNIFDTFPEEEYEAITQLAARICQTPISTISLVDSNREWFKSAHGLTIRLTPREYLLCSYAIQTPSEIMEVYDARTDERFAGNPLVRGDPDVVFYAGVPLIDADGYALGILCVINHQPQYLTTDQKQTLKALGRQVVAQIQLHHTQRLLKESNEQLLMLNQELQPLGQAEHRLQHLLAQEKELSQEKMRFVAVVSHEFRTPLTTIQLRVELIRLYIKGKTEAAVWKILKQVVIIEEELSRLNELLSNVLILGQVGANKLPFNPLLCDAVAFIHELTQSFLLGQRTERLVTIRVHGLPQLVLLDKKMLTYALVNLLTNALKYSSENPELHLYYEPDQLVFAVVDTGIGIPREDLPHLFTSFFRAKNTMNVPGNGLGLFIARQFVDLHGGRIDVVSQQHQGSTFRIILPTKGISS